MFTLSRRETRFVSFTLSRNPLFIPTLTIAGGSYLLQMTLGWSDQAIEDAKLHNAGNDAACIAKAAQAMIEDPQNNSARDVAGYDGVVVCFIDT